MTRNVMSTSKQFRGARDLSTSFPCASAKCLLQVCSLLLLLIFLPPTASADLLVSGFHSGNVLRYDETNGTFIDVFVPPGSGGLANPVGLAIGPDGNLYVGNYYWGEILRYDGTTGAFIDVFANGCSVSGDILFGPDGNLYVACEFDRVLRFNGTSGAFIDNFVATGSGGLDRPTGMVFGPDGDLYVSGLFSDNVLRYDGVTGSFIDEFVPANPVDHLYGPVGLAFGPDGNFYVASSNNGLTLRYDGTTGDFLDIFTQGAGVPAGIVFAPDGQLYMANYVGDSILRFDGSTGAFVDVFVSPGSGGLDLPLHFIFTSPPDSDGDGVIDSADACPYSDLSSTIVISGVDTGIENDLLQDGCTLSDLIASIIVADPSTADIVQFLVDLRAEGIITGHDLGTILQSLNSPN